MSRERWQTRAACLGSDPADFFPDVGGGYAAARRYCDVCPVVAECLAYAFETEPDILAFRHGMFGGKTPLERHQIWKAAAA